MARKLGSPILRVVAGNLFTRDEGHDMAALADRAVAILREACRAAEDLGMKIAMENHADFTVRELASIFARVDSPAFGFTVDAANLAFDLDDPLRLAEILAPHALTTHFKNYRILRTAEGLALENCALGDGDIDLAAIAETAGQAQPDNQPEHRDPLPVCPVSAGHPGAGLLVAASARRRATAWRGTWRRPGAGRCPIPGPTTARRPGVLGARSRRTSTPRSLGEARTGRIYCST